MLWAGYETTAKVIILFLFAFFPMVINTYQGVKVGRPEAARSRPRVPLLGAAALDQHRAARRVAVHRHRHPLAVGRGMIGMVLADLYTAISGIGYLIVRTAATFQVDRMFVPIVTLGLLGVTLTALLRVVEKLVAPWTAAGQED